MQLHRLRLFVSLYYKNPYGTVCWLMLILRAVYSLVFIYYHCLPDKLEKNPRELGRCTFPAGPLSVTIAPWLALQDAVSPGNKSPFLKWAGKGEKKNNWNENGLLIPFSRSWEELHLKRELSTQ